MVVIHAAAVLRVLKAARTCPACHRRQVVSEHAKGHPGHCKFCGATISDRGRAKGSQR